MSRIALGIEYDGSRFHGWQSQPGVDLPTVQSAVENALGVVADHALDVICAGRTDRGVHSNAQVVHFDTNADRAEHSWVLGGNANLPPDIRVHWARPVESGFHARFSALARRYRYVIVEGRVRSALQRQRVCWSRQSLDVSAMSQATACLLGSHDFSSFRGSGCQSRHPVRELRSITVERHGALVAIEVEANAFLLHMVRNIAGVLMAVGRGERAVSWVAEVLAARDRRGGGVTAPPQGLYLTAVRYPQSYRLPQPPWCASPY